VNIYSRLFRKSTPETTSGLLRRNSQKSARHSIHYVKGLYSWLLRNSILKSVTVCCSALRCAAACCRVLQTTQLTFETFHLEECCSVLRCVAVCCSALQCVAVRCGVLQSVADFAADFWEISSRRVLQCVAACCSVLQCVAVCCSVLRCVAVCCRLHSWLVRYFISKTRRMPRVIVCCAEFLKSTPCAI